jgi:ubiquinone/menaquinone biosynthesis C-methylase UbiE
MKTAGSFFSRHATAYSRNPSFTRGSDLKALLLALRPAKTDSALDVATGTGATAVALSSYVRNVVGVDTNMEMLGQARLQVSRRRIKNATFEPGNALRLRYPDASFDLVVSRRAAHHFRDVPRFLSEAKRLLRPRGRLGIVDMVPPEGAEAFVNAIERQRDRGHVRAFSPSQWRAMVAEGGMVVIAESILNEPLSFGAWLYPVRDGREESLVRKSWASAPAEVKRLLGAVVREGAVQGWTKSRIILIAVAKTP